MNGKEKPFRFLSSISGAITGLLLWAMFRCTLLLLRLPPLSRRAPPVARSGFRVLLTGRVDSKNWCMAHLLPLTRAANISELLLVIDGDVAPAPKTRQFIVPKAIGWFRPRAIIRSIWAVVVALREKPDIVMGYCLFPPGLFALLAARWSGAAAIVQLAGGPPEVEAGGYLTDDPFIPRFLVRRLVPLCRRFCSHFDAVIVRGQKGLDYMRQHRQPGHVEIISASVDPARYHLNGQTRSIDIAFVGRIVSVKQPDHICEVVKRVAQRHPKLRVVIAGDGPLLKDMKDRARALGLQEVMRFVGHVERVEGLLIRSRVFLLTSRSEGLSIAMAEAMTAGAVPVVSDVGDLAELVINGETGWLVKPGDFDVYADRICGLLGNPRGWQQMSNNAIQKAVNNNGAEQVKNRWQKCIATVMGEKPATPNVETAPPSNGPVPRDLNPTTAFFSQGGEDLANHYKKVACFRDRCALFVGGLQRTTPLPAKVLDFGCGPGVLSVELAKLGYDVLGLDGATGMVSTARASLARLGLRTARFEHLDAGFFEPNMGTFDAVVCSSVLEYIEDDVGLLAKLIACVRPGGHLFISIPHSANVFTPIEPLAHAIKLRLTRRREGHLVHSIHRYQRERFMETCQRLGMENIRCTSFECPVLGQLGVRLSRFPFLSRMFFFEARKSIPVKPARAEAVNSHCG